MVGVASRSKGCTTCRRRKIRCHQERPHCSNCVKAGRSCEGYERYPVFINRTAQGIQRRKPLEEAKPAWSNANVEPTAEFALPAVCLLLSPSAHAVWSVAFLSWFWENYAPADGAPDATMRRPVWLYSAMNLSNPTVALQQSLLALAVVRRGRSSGDNAIVNGGRRIYGQALGVLQRELYDRQRASHEETLAATRAMALYELFEATSNTAASWQSHVKGLACLMTSRGPWSYSTPLARAVYEEFQYPLMVQSITLRRGYALTGPVWRTAPWAKTVKDKEQVLYDLGLSLACLLKQVDEVATTEDDGALLLRVMQSSLELKHALDRFRDEHLDRIVGCGQRSADGEISSVISALGLDGLAMTWWAVRVHLVFATKRLSAQALAALARHARLPLLTRESVASFSEQLIASCDDKEIDNIGRRFLGATYAMLRGNPGHFWLSRTIFPLMAATLHFHTSRPEMEMCLKIRDQIVSEKGFRFTSIARSGPGQQISFRDEHDRAID